MDCQMLKSQIAGTSLGSRAVLEKLYMYVTAGDAVLPEFAEYLDASATYAEFFDAIYQDASKKDTLLWAEIAKFKRRNWLQFFKPKLLVNNVRLKADGIPIQFDSGIMLAPTGSRDNIANLYVFENGGFNAQAAEFVTSVGGTFNVLDYRFCGIYGIYKYRGSVIMEEWEVEREPERVDPNLF